MLNLNCRRWFELSSDAAGGWKALPGGNGYPCNEGGGETGQVALVEEYILDYNVKLHWLKTIILDYNVKSHWLENIFWTTNSSRTS